MVIINKSKDILATPGQVRADERPIDGRRHGVEREGQVLGQNGARPHGLVE